MQRLRHRNSTRRCAPRLERVKITVSAFANRQFQGKVDSIALMPQDNLTSNSASSNSRHEIPVKIQFDQSSIQAYESRFTPGMSAVVKVETN